jgi:hypothetical protein
MNTNLLANSDNPPFVGRRRQLKAVGVSMTIPIPKTKKKSTPLGGTPLGSTPLGTSLGTPTSSRLHHTPLVTPVGSPN